MVRAVMPVTLVAVSLTVLGCGDLVRKLAKARGDAGDDAGAVAVAVDSVDAGSWSPSADDTGASKGAGITAPGVPNRAGTKAADGRTSPALTGTAPANTAASRAELEKAFAALDINDDDQLDGIEVKRCGCAIADTNGDTEVTKAEYLAAGLSGKFRPGPAADPGPSPSPSPAPSPGPTSTPTQTPTSPTPPPAPAAGGVPPGLYKCSGMVGAVYMTTGRLLIIDGTRYATGSDGSGQGTYKFFPDTGMIVFTSGPNQDMSQISFARLVAPNRIQMKAGKNGTQNWDCKR